MKFTLLISLLFSTIPSFSRAEIVNSITFSNGSTVNVQTQVNSVATDSHDNVQWIELLDGEIFYDSEIVKINGKDHSITSRVLQDFTKSGSTMRVVSGGDGSGGG